MKVDNKGAACGGSCGIKPRIPYQMHQMKEEEEEEEEEEIKHAEH